MVTNTIIKKGYKQTEIGVIPEDWKVKKLEEVGETYGGLSGKKKSDFDGGKYPYIPFMNIMSNPVIDLQYFDYVNIRGNEKQNKAINGDLFFNGSSETPEEVGMCSVLQGDIPNLYLNSFCFGFRLNKDLKTDGLYLSYFFRSPMGRQSIFSLAQGATRYNLSKTNFMKLEIPYPDPVEQTAIATVLSDTDALIEQLEKLIAKRKAIKQGTMQQLLTGKKRLPGFNGEWEVKTLGEIGKFKGGSGFPIKYQGKAESKYPFYKVSDMNNKGNQTFMRNSNNWIDESTKKIIGSNVFPEHTIVFAKIGAAIYLERKKILFMKSCIDNNMMGFIFDESQSDYRFLHYLFLSIQLGKLVSATALPSLNGKQIGELSFAFPRKKEQTAIATILSDMDAEIERLEKKRDKYIMLKQGMMQQLLTGRIRINANN